MREERKRPAANNDMKFNDLLVNSKIDPREVMVFRHRPREPELNRVFPWLAAERPAVFNAYQQTHGARVERALKKASYVASFVGHVPGKALFVGLYSVGASKPLTRAAYWRVPAYKEMKAFGMEGFGDDEARSSVLWFDLRLTDFYSAWKGTLVLEWTGSERSWWRWAQRNDFNVSAMLEDSALDAAMKRWDRFSGIVHRLAVSEGVAIQLGAFRHPQAASATFPR
jgi:hypothetical protein